MKTTDKIIVIDLEATCWEGQPPAGQVNEIIEIGICELDTLTGDITKNKGILIQPTRSTISPFCTQLTTITPELVAREGVTFPEAIEMLQEEYEAEMYTWASYGMYDLNMLTKQCKFRNINYPLNHQHINVKELFAETFGLRKATGMNWALELLKIPLEGTHHRGVDDAKNIAKILHWCLKQ